MLGLELLDHVANGFVVDLWSFELVSHDVLDLRGVEGDNVLLKGGHIHIGRKLGVGDGRVGGRDHRCPGANVDLVNVLDDVLKAELRKKYHAI